MIKFTPVLKKIYITSCFNFFSQIHNVYVNIEAFHLRCSSKIYVHLVFVR